MTPHGGIGALDRDQTGHVWRRATGRHRRSSRRRAQKGKARMSTGFEHGTTSKYRAGCRCDLCRSANTEACRASRANRVARVKSNSVTQEITHGLSAYTNWGCRCPICSEAGRERNAETRRRAKAGLISHVRGGAVAECPCGRCHETLRAYTVKHAKKVNDSSRLSASKHRQHWTSVEMEIAISPVRTAREAAAILGRTVAAVQSIRMRTKKDPRLQRVVDDPRADKCSR